MLTLSSRKVVPRVIRGAAPTPFSSWPNTNTNLQGTTVHRGAQNTEEYNRVNFSKGTFE